MEDREVFDAVQRADLRKLSRLLKLQGCNPLLLRSPQGFSLLHAAASANNHIVASFLLDTVSQSIASNSLQHWANFSASDGTTALHVACSQGNVVTAT